MREVEMFVELSGLRPYVPHQRTSCSSLFDWRPLAWERSHLLVVGLRVLYHGVAC